MDFETILHKAQQNDQSTRQGNWYRTSFSPPKKMQREKKLSDNIKNFLAKKEEEEKLKRLQERRKKEDLLALRKQDKKSTRRVQTMLKLTKSANKSVIDDAKDNVNTAVTAAGPLQPDEDDYGYVSVEAAKLYDQLINKYSNIQPQKSSSIKSLRKSSHEISNTKDRVKAAIQREEDDKLLPRKRKRKDKTSDEYSGLDNNNYKEEQVASESSDTGRNKSVIRKKVPSNTLDFQSLLKVAEKKQHEPIVIEKKVKVTDEGRPMTQKEKMEYLRELERKRNKQHKLIRGGSKGENTEGRRPDTTDKMYKQRMDVNAKPHSKEKRIQGSLERSEKLDMRNVEDKLRKDSRVWSAPCNRSRPLKKAGGPYNRNDDYASEILRKIRDVDKDINKKNRYDESSRNRSCYNGHMNKNNVLVQDNDMRKDTQPSLTKEQKSGLNMRDRERCKDVNKTQGYRERDSDRIRRSNEGINADAKSGNNNVIRYKEKNIDESKIKCDDRRKGNEMLGSSNKKDNNTRVSYKDRNDKERNKRHYTMDESDTKVSKDDDISKGNYKLQKKYADPRKYPSKVSINETSRNSNTDSRKLSSNNNVKEKKVKETRETSVDRRVIINGRESSKKMYDMKERNSIMKNGNYYDKRMMKVERDDSAHASTFRHLEKPKSGSSIVNSKLKQSNAMNVKPRQFPPHDVRRIKRPMKRPAAIVSDSEYDSEMDSFIDDNEDDAEDYSKYISEIFGYDRSKYRNDVDDDECMESNFAQLQKEEFESTKSGILEDLADIRREKWQQKRSINRRK